jgi:hypothetical protein
VDPTRKADRLADVGEAQFGAIVGAVGVHCVSFSIHVIPALTRDLPFFRR